MEVYHMVYLRLSAAEEERGEVDKEENGKEAANSMAFQRQGFKAHRMKLGSLLLLLFFTYALVLFQPYSLYDNGEGTGLVRYTHHDSHMNAQGKMVVQQKRIVEVTIANLFLYELGGNARIGLVNMECHRTNDWWSMSQTIDVPFDRVSENLVWDKLFPGWIDEEERRYRTSCPEIPLPNLDDYGEVDVVVVSVPCRYPEEGWTRDVFRLQVHLVAAKVAARMGRRDDDGKVRLVLQSKCQPMMDIFRCDDMIRREGDWWMYVVEAWKLEEKVVLPVGSCKLAMPMMKGNINDKSDIFKLRSVASPTRREAYTTVIHSSDRYVCGAIALAQSILRTGTDRDLVLLHDDFIPQEKLAALAAAGWKLHKIKRIHNPYAKKGTYNEYNYSKLRLWQLTEYTKLVFIDSDIIVLRNLDLLFHLPQLSAAGNDGFMFNSGVMVIEPSKCTFRFLVERRHEVISYNGGDQGFINEAFVWWHRLPSRVNYLKLFWANTSKEAAAKNKLFGSDPPELYSIHYVGRKPWTCYRDYDCNWDTKGQRMYASDVAHRRWFDLYDKMDERMKPFCGLTVHQKRILDWGRKLAAKAGFPDEHWKLNISDRRRFDTISI